jgi:predicted nuclease of predicted toxin-antitoxin system
MRIKIDENMPTELAGELGALGHDVHTVHDEGLEGTSDEVVGNAARAEKRFLITQDKGFADLREWEADPGGGVMLVRIDHDTRQELIDAVMSVFRAEPVEAWAGKHVKVTRKKVRVQSLGKESA